MSSLEGSNTQSRSRSVKLPPLVNMHGGCQLCKFERASYTLILQVLGASTSGWGYIATLTGWATLVVILVVLGTGIGLATFKLELREL